MSSIRRRLEKIEEKVEVSLKSNVVPIAIGTSEEIEIQVEEIRRNNYEGLIICFDDIKITR